MKTIGLIGGMSWESSLEYYRIINECVKERLGGLHSAKILMYSFDFDEIEGLQHKGSWSELARLMVGAAVRLEGAGADCILLCTNTMHKAADDVQGKITIPLLHIADATAERIKEENLKRVGLLGTRFTMEEDFYRGRLVERHGLEVIVPGGADRAIVHEVIYRELCAGVISESSRQRFKGIIEGLASNGAEGVILGCTEIPLLLRREDVRLPLFDTTRIHAESAVEYALKG